MRLFHVDHFFDSLLCRQVRTAMDEGIAEPAGIFTNALRSGGVDGLADGRADGGATDGTTDGIVVADTVRRVNDIEIAPALLHTIETRLDSSRASLETFFGQPLAEREGTSVLRYQAGGFYRPHRDRGADASWPGTARRSVAIVLFLNTASRDAGSGEFSGGALRFWSTRDEPYDVIPREGRLIAFPATVLHEVRPVLTGTRDTVVDWFYDP